jgi:hypothetical protein
MSEWSDKTVILLRWLCDQMGFEIYDAVLRRSGSVSRLVLFSSNETEWMEHGECQTQDFRTRLIQGIRGWEYDWIFIVLCSKMGSVADPSGCAVLCMGLRALACWGFGFWFHRGRGCLSLLWVMCVVSERSLRRADHSSWGVLPITVCLSVIVKPWYKGSPGRLKAVAEWGRGSSLKLFNECWKDAYELFNDFLLRI